MADLKPQFDIIRAAIKDHPDKSGTPLAIAALDVIEETMSKLERIAVATEAVAQTVNYAFGEPAVRIRADQ